MPHHQLAYLTADRMVAWKSLSAIKKGQPIVPLAYASRSRSFFSSFFKAKKPGEAEERPDAVLWVFSSPLYKRKLAFSPSLTACLTIRGFLGGDEVRSWATNPAQAELDVPSRRTSAFDDWRQARSVEGAVRRSIFRITRVYALEAKRAAGKKKKNISAAEAWESVRVAVADPAHSRFLPHIDATIPLSELTGHGEWPGLPPAERSLHVSRSLQSPRPVHTERLAHVEKLKALLENAGPVSVFISYRWKKATDEKVAALSQLLLDQGCAVWLDRLTIPGFEDRRRKGRDLPEGPSSDLLQWLLFDGIDRSALFLALAGEDYDGPSRDGQGRNWAYRELQQAVRRREREGRPEVQVMCLGECPGALKEKWPCRNWEEAGTTARQITTLLASDVK